MNIEQIHPSCPSVFGKWFGHKFIDIYDTQTLSYLPSNTSSIENSTVAAIEALKTKSTSKTFVHLACVRCGHVIKRSPIDYSIYNYSGMFNGFPSTSVSGCYPLKFEDGPVWDGTTD